MTPHVHRFTYMKLKLLLLFCQATLVLSLSAGCSFSHKNKKPKENPAIASEVEAEFRQRWLDRRVTELVGKGTDASTAKAQAEAEFHERYPYVKDAPKKP
jgi:hypothetical protein